MKDKINFNVFCDDSRERIKNPFVYDGFVYATNGQVIIRTKENVNNYKPIEKSIITKSIDGFPWGKTKEKLKTMPPIPTQNLEDIDCKECDGVGEVSFSNIHNYYECDCKSCDGYGKIEKELKVQLEAVSKLPGIKYDSELTRVGLHFFFKGGEGFILNCWP